MIFVTKCLNLFQKLSALKGKGYVGSRLHFLLDDALCSWHTDADVIPILFMGAPATKKVFVGGQGSCAQERIV